MKLTGTGCVSEQYREMVDKVTRSTEDEIDATLREHLRLADHQARQRRRAALQEVQE